MVTQRKGPVQIVNNTGRTLLSVSIAHKYSDNYKNEHTWELIKNQETSSTTTVDYNTGFGTTGRDWWLVTWVDNKGNTYMTDPKNFQDVLNFFEKITNSIAEPLVTLGTAVATGSPEPSTKTLAAAAAVVGGLTTSLLNTEGTAGFKQHILRAEDEGRPTKIIIKEDNKVEFNSKSGISKTGSRKVSSNDPNEGDSVQWIPKNPENEKVNWANKMKDMDNKIKLRRDGENVIND